jgi:3-dehydroquinate synthetase
VVKAAILASPLLLDWLEAEEPMTNLGWVIEQSVRIKAGYVAVDPRDRGVRKSLNLGHTFAHAVEAGSDYSISHGAAVASGLLAATMLGKSHGITDPELEERLPSILGRLGFRLSNEPRRGTDRELAALEADKKRRSGETAFVVPAPGGAALLEGLSAPERFAFDTEGKA